MGQESPHCENELTSPCSGFVSGKPALLLQHAPIRRQSKRPQGPGVRIALAGWSMDAPKHPCPPPWPYQTYDFSDGSG